MFRHLKVFWEPRPPLKPEHIEALATAAAKWYNQGRADPKLKEALEVYFDKS